MKKIQKRTPLILFAAFAISLLLTSCGSKNNQGQFGRTATVSVATVEYASAPTQQEYHSTLVANKQTNLISDVGGRVEALLFNEGGYVRKGQPLYNIDKSRYQAIYDQAVAQLKIAQTNLITDKTDAQRYQNLWDHNAVDKIQLDHANAQVEVAKATVISAEANVAHAKTDLDHATVVAPFGGTTDVSKVRLGDLVVANQTPLVTIVDNTNMMADFFIPEGDYVKLGASDKNIKDKLSHFNLILPDGSAYQHKGKLDFVDNTVDPTTGTIMVRLSFPNPGAILKSGMNCVVRSTQNNNGEKSIIIPQQAVQQLLDEYYVYVVNDNGIVKETEIKPGLTSGNMQIILSGLKPGQKVIVEGIEKVKPNEKVNTVPYSNGPAKTN